jgi:hypothetical protein
MTMDSDVRDKCLLDGRTTGKHIQSLGLGFHWLTIEREIINYRYINVFERMHFMLSTGVRFVASRCSLCLSIHCTSDCD